MKDLTDKQRTIFEALHNSRAEDFKILNKRDYRGVWTTIIDKYPESAHFVYELLQNADDVEASYAEIILRDNDLLFKHNGKKHFDVSEDGDGFLGDINSITGIGDSTKIDTQNKIGKFGVGFKAVFQYTNTPKIYDDVYKFKIENYIIPTLLDRDHPERKEGETLFVFPFFDREKSHKDISERLRNLQNPLLFLNHLQQISWRIDISGQKGQSVSYIKELKENIKYKDGVTLSRYTLMEPNEMSSMFLFSENIFITNDGKETNHLIHVGFYYDEENKKLITDKERNIYCFFPTKATFHTCFVSHAPFLLIDNRQDLKPSEEINQILCNQLASLAAKSILHLRDYGIKHHHLLIDENILDIIHPFEENKWYWDEDYFNTPIKEEFAQVLKNDRLLLSRNNEYMSLDESYTGSPHDLFDLISKEQLQYLIKVDEDEDVDEYDYHDEDDKDNLFDASKVDFLKWELSQKIQNEHNSIYGQIDTFTSNSLASFISSKFMSEQDIRWVTRFYTFLRNSPTLWKVTDNNRAPFRTLPIIKIQDGRWVAPFDKTNNSNVFLPISGKSSKEYNIISQEYLDNAIAAKFFNELEISTPDESAFIFQVVLSKYKSAEFSIDNDDLGEDLCAILNYYRKLKDTKDEDHFIHDLQVHLSLACTDDALHALSNNPFNSHENIYIPTPMLVKYFARSKNVLFFDWDFYRPYLKQYSDEFILDFLLKLGCLQYPELKKINTYQSVLNERVRSAITIRTYKESTIQDWMLTGFLNWADNNVQKDVSLYVWNEMLPKIGFAQGENLDFAYRQAHARNFEHAYYYSSFKDNLQHEKWIFDRNGKVKSPCEIALEDLAPEYDRNNGLLHFLGVEKREKSIVELGGTEEQQANMEIGKRIMSAAGKDLTPDEILQAICDAKAKKLGQQHKNDSSNSYENTPAIQQDETQIDDILNGTPQTPQQSPAQRPKPTPKSKYESEEEWLENQEKLEQHNSRLEIVNDPTKRYTAEWFRTLLDMEFEATGDKTNERGGIKIKFSKVERDPNSDKGILLRNPSNTIPRSLEELNNIVVIFHFSSHEDMTITFEVASVQDYVLKLKCKNEDIQTVKELVTLSKEVVFAELNTQNPIQLIAKLRSAFHEQLRKEDDFSFKENINPNIEFVFGPPGTGKTTHLVKSWINKIAIKPKGKMLVLCPTNKAADVIANRALTTLNPLSHPESYIYRFVATADDVLEHNVCDRASNVFYQDKCCVISTIARFSYDGFIDAKLRDIDWDYIVIDEASMIPLAEIIYPLYQCTRAQIVIAGDPFQIEPIVMVDEWKDENIYKMINLNDFQHPQTEPCPFKITNLSTQYRAVPAIGRLFSNYMYGGGVNSNREQSSQRKLNLGGYDVKSVNFVMCPVENGLSIYGAQRLMKSNIHIYSALFTYEFALWLANRIQRQNDEKPWKIGIISPYRAQADLIDKLWEQRRELFDNVELLVSTVHGFQGDECDIIIAVYNPPASGMKLRADDTFVNKQNILNVAISRAQDYLFLVMPDNKYDYFYKLQATKIFNIAAEERNQMTLFEASAIEKVMFNDKEYLSKHTFVTSHQLANVYTEPVSKYEVRFDENSVDIQIKS